MCRAGVCPVWAQWWGALRWCKKCRVGSSTGPNAHERNCLPGRTWCPRPRSSPHGGRADAGAVTRSVTWSYDGDAGCWWHWHCPRLDSAPSGPHTGTGWSLPIHQTLPRPPSSVTWPPAHTVVRFNKFTLVLKNAQCPQVFSSPVFTAKLSSVDTF